MMNYERYRKYIETQCPNCKNRVTDLCEIRIIQFDGEIITSCVYFEKDKEVEKPKKRLWTTAKRKRPLMKL